MENEYQVPNHGSSEAVVSSQPETIIKSGDNNTYQYQNTTFYRISDMIAASLFSVYALVYMMYRNYKNMGKDIEAKKLLYFGMTITTLVYIIAVFVMHQPYFYIELSAVVYVSIKQRGFIKEHRIHGAKFQPLWKTLGVTVLFLLPLLMIVMSYSVYKIFFLHIQ